MTKQEPWLKSADPELQSEWDAWIAAHDRVVAAQAWDEGVWMAANSDSGAREFQKRNPYRTEESN